MRHQNTDPVIQLSGLRKSYGDVTAVDGLDLSVVHGEVFGLLGPNGAGKTTTLECLVGLRRPTAGTIRVLGLDPFADRAAITRRVAVQPQSASLFDTLTVRETLELFASFHEDPLPTGDVIERVGLGEQADRRASRLSGGQTRRLLLAVALVADPEILVLDEPSAGLDPAARQSLWGVIETLRAGGTTVVLSTHHMDEATTVCDRVAIIVRGRLAALDTPDELIRQHTSTSDVAFTVAADVPESAIAAELGDVAFTAERVLGGTRVRLRSADPDGVIRRVTFARSFRAGEFAVRADTLEDVFLELSAEGDG